MNSIDIVIPTLWCSETLTEALENYVKCEYIQRIFIVDNKTSSKPNSIVLSHEKIDVISYGRNIYVNPAWNEGYYRSNADVICFLNDDIIVETDIFKDIASLDFADIDLIGVHLKGSADNYHIVDHLDKVEKLFKLDVNKTKPIGGQAYAFGVCMFVKRQSYKVIPSLYQIWYGDDYLVQNCENIYVLKTSKIHGEISKTIKNLTTEAKSEIQDRIDLDSYNVYHYNHFTGAKDWEFARRAAVQRSKPKIKNTLKTEYINALSTPSDINENVNILYELALECNTVAEFGVRTGVSTRAFLYANVRLLSFDLELNSRVQQLFDEATKQGKEVQYIQDDVLNIEIDQVDMLFIDTLHTYEQLSMELKLHGNKAAKYIVFHDTYTYGLRGESNQDKKGLLTAIIEFMIDNPHWKFKINKTNNNGLLVLERYSI